MPLYLQKESSNINALNDTLVSRNLVAVLVLNLTHLPLSSASRKIVRERIEFACEKSECEFVCDVTDLESIFIANEITGRRKGGAKGGGFLFLAIPFACICVARALKTNAEKKNARRTR